MYISLFTEKTNESHYCVGAEGHACNSLPALSGSTPCRPFSAPGATVSVSLIQRRSTGAAESSWCTTLDTDPYAEALYFFVTAPPTGDCSSNF